MKREMCTFPAVQSIILVTKSDWKALNRQETESKGEKTVLV